MRKLSFIITIMLSQSAHAHQQKEAYSTALFNERSGMLEVSHRFYIHDAEHSLRALYGTVADLVSASSTQQRFADYVLKHFRIKVDQQLLALEVIGHEVDGKYFWVYQETDIPTEISRIEVSMTALQDVWPTQVNHVNVERAGRISSARLGIDDQFKVVHLTDPTVKAK